MVVTGMSAPLPTHRGKKGATLNSYALSQVTSTKMHRSQDMQRSRLHSKWVAALE